MHYRSRQPLLGRLPCCSECCMCMCMCVRACVCARVAVRKGVRPRMCPLVYRSPNAQGELEADVWLRWSERVLCHICDCRAGERDSAVSYLLSSIVWSLRNPNSWCHTPSVAWYCPRWRRQLALLATSHIVSACVGWRCLWRDLAVAMAVVHTYGLIDV